MHELPIDVDRVAIAGDWHGDTPYAKRAMDYAVANGAQGIIHTGDFGVWPGQAGKKYLAAVEKALAKRGLWLAFVDGNHDDHWQIRDRPLNAAGLRPFSEHLAHLPRGFRWNWAGSRWVALGGAVSMDKLMRSHGVSWWPEETITQEQAHAVMDEGEAEVMITHDVAASVDVPGLLTDWNPRVMGEAQGHRTMLGIVASAVRPIRWWHGHMHVDYTREVDFGGMLCTVRGLNCNGEPLENNIAIVSTRTLNAPEDLKDPTS